MSGDELTLQQARQWCRAFGEFYMVRHDWVIRCHRAGMSFTEISAKTGLARHTISNWVTEDALRAGLAEAAAGVEPSPGGLDAIQARIRQD